jgi:hypothetical protein
LCRLELVDFSGQAFQLNTHLMELLQWRF